MRNNGRQITNQKEMQNDFRVGDAKLVAVANLVSRIDGLAILCK